MVRGDRALVAPVGAGQGAGDPVTVADGPEAVRRLRGANLAWLKLALVAVLAQTGLSALRWWLVARTMGIDLPLRRAVTGYFVAQVVNQTLPGGIPGDVARAVRSRGQGGLRAAAGAVVAGRPAGQIALVALMIPALALSRAAGLIDRLPVTGWGLAILTALAGLAVMLQLPASVTPLRVPCKPDVRPGQAVLGSPSSC